MVVSALSCERTVFEVEDLLQVLQLRGENDANEFILSKEPRSFPQLTINVTGARAFCCYWPYDGHPGWNSPSKIDHGDDVRFALGEMTNYIEMNERYVIPIATAYEVAKEFLLSNAMPTTIRWESLAAGE